MDITDDTYTDMYNVFLNISLLFLPMLFVYNLKSVSSAIRRRVFGQRIKHRVSYNSDSLDDSSSDLSETDDNDNSDTESDLSDDTIILEDKLTEHENGAVLVTDEQPDEQAQNNKRQVNEEILRRGSEMSHDTSLNNLEEKIRDILNDL
jgi:hypothetical protein